MLYDCENPWRGLRSVFSTVAKDKQDAIYSAWLLNCCFGIIRVVNGWLPLTCIWNASLVSVYEYISKWVFFLYHVSNTDFVRKMIFLVAWRCFRQHRLSQFQPNCLPRKHGCYIHVEFSQTVQEILGGWIFKYCSWLNLSVTSKHFVTEWEECACLF